MSIKLADYIENPEQPLSDEDWLKIYMHSLLDNAEIDEKLAEELLSVSNEALEIELEEEI